MPETPKDGLSFDEVCAAACQKHQEEHERQFPRLDGGKKCPPFQATIYRLADAESLGTALDEELQRVKEHTGVCSSCRHTYEAAYAFFSRATPEEGSVPEVVGGVDFERSPIRALRIAAQTLTKDMVAGMTPCQVFAVVCATAGLETEKGVKALGLGLCPDWLDDDEIMRANLELLGVPEEILPAE